MSEPIQTQPPREPTSLAASRPNPRSEKVEYLYLSRLEQKRIVQQKVGYRWKLLLTSAARQGFQDDMRRAITEMLNDLGTDGWQLAGIAPVTVFGVSIGCEMIFQRTLPPQEPTHE